MKKRNRIIINVGENVSDEIAVDMVYQVIRQGRISNDGDNYCYVTQFSSVNHSHYSVYCRRNKSSDSFYVSKDNA